MSLSAAGVFTTPVFSTKVILPSSDSHQQPTVNSTNNEWSPTPFSIWVPCHCSMVCGRGQSESGYGHNRCPFFFFFLHGVLPHWLSLRRSPFFYLHSPVITHGLPFSTCHHYRVVIIFFNMEFCHTGYLYEGKSWNLVIENLLKKKTMMPGK